MFRDYKTAYMLETVPVKEKRPLSFLRQSVAYVLSQSARRIPHAAWNNQYDVTPLIEYTRSDGVGKADSGSRSSADELRKRALRKNYSAFFLKALAHTLYNVPQLNGWLEYSPIRDGGALYLAEDINLSFTVHTKFGVIKPILRNAHQKDLETVAEEMRVLTRKARRTDPEVLYRRAARRYIRTALRQVDFTGLLALWIYLRSLVWQRYTPDPALEKLPEEQKLQVEDILGATCTVANIGMMIDGHQTLTVIIPPEVSMVGIGDIRLTPLVVNGEVVPRYTVTVCGTIDHRAFDAGEVFPFGKHLQRYLDDPALIYAWKPGDPI